MFSNKKEDKSSQIFGSSNEGSSSSTTADKINDLEKKVDRLVCLCKALWDVIKESNKIDSKALDEPFQKYLNELKKNNTLINDEAKKCANCNRPINLRLKKCLYCGSEAIFEDIFDHI